MVMVHLYAPADTENVPILSKKERKQKKIASYILLSVAILVACIIPNNEISNILGIWIFYSECNNNKICIQINQK